MSDLSITINVKGSNSPCLSFSEFIHSQLVIVTRSRERVCFFPLTTPFLTGLSVGIYVRSLVPLTTFTHSPFVQFTRSHTPSRDVINENEIVM